MTLMYLQIYELFKKWGRSENEANHSCDKINAPGFPPSFLLSDTKTEHGRILTTSRWDVVLYHFVFLDKGTNLDKVFPTREKGVRNQLPCQ